MSHPKEAHNGDHDDGQSYRQGHIAKTQAPTPSHAWGRAERSNKRFPNIFPDFDPNIFPDFGPTVLVRD
jgi:hypothetical protein